MLIVWFLFYIGGRILLDENTMILSVEDKPVVRAEIKDEGMHIEWLENSWKNWQQLTDATEFQELVEKTTESLRVAKGLRAKGKGKGKGKE